MKTFPLTYDHANMHAKRSGRFAVHPSEWARITPRLREARKEVQKLARSEERGFLSLPFDRSLEKRCNSLSATLRRSFSDIVVLGVGGSDLGARALFQALEPAYRERARKRLHLHFAGSSTDPDELYRLLHSLDLKRTCVNVISKSGSTLETMTAFLVFRKALIDAVGRKNASSHIIATTDPEEGTLRDIARREGYTTLPIPANVGGRFSVLSAVGLLPAAAAGYRIADILSGARLILDRFHEESVGNSEILAYAGLHVLGMERRKQCIHVLMPYSVRLESFAKWVRQLVAESLGKKQNRRGDVVYAGPTPVVSIGPEDQHSQLQLYSEGPFDKIITFLETKRFDHALRTPMCDDAVQELAAFGGKRFQDLIHLERYATAESLRRDGRPNGTLLIDRIDERSLGALFMYFEIAVSIMGELMNVYAYTQPGVEASKRIMKEGMKRRNMV